MVQGIERPPQVSRQVVVQTGVVMGWLSRRRVRRIQQDLQHAAEAEFEAIQALIAKLQGELDAAASVRPGWKRGEGDGAGWYYESHDGHVATIVVDERREPGYPPCYFLQLRLADWDFRRDGPPKCEPRPSLTAEEALESAELIAMAPPPAWRRPMDQRTQATGASPERVSPEVEEVLDEIFRPARDSRTEDDSSG